jgi:predicted methyltransferase
VLSRFEAAEVLLAHAEGRGDVETSVDLGMTRTTLQLDASGVPLPDGTRLGWDVLGDIAESELSCFTVGDASATPIRHYSETSARTFSLMATGTSPALLVSGFVMHRIRDVTPREGALRMVQSLGRLQGRLLDTATGLGYAAIEAARQASEVVSIELEPGARQMARENPWSRDLFSLPNVRLLLGSSADLLPTFEAGEFAAAVHDPPAVNIAGDLYSVDFYREMHRVLSRTGRFFHYIGDPGKPSGARTTAGVVRRLLDAGFSRVEKRPAAFGVLARK